MTAIVNRVHYHRIAQHVPDVMVAQRRQMNATRLLNKLYLAKFQAGQSPALVFIFETLTYEQLAWRFYDLKNVAWWYSVTL